MRVAVTVICLDAGFGVGTGDSAVALRLGAEMGRGSRSDNGN